MPETTQPDPQGRRPVVFLGPTMKSAEAAELLDGIYLPPASQGSIVDAVQRYQPEQVLLIDGVFQGQPAVRHKELLWAMAQGISVYGSASLGALRAAELHPFGMIGVGMIFRWYRRYRYAPDDAVAVLHGPAELHSVPLTRSSIDLRLTFRLASKQGLISRKARAQLDLAAVQLNFRDRTIPNVVEHAQRYSSDGLQGHKEITEILENIFFSQKRQDAIRSLRIIGEQLSEKRPVRPSRPEFVRTAVFMHDLRDAGLRID